MDKATLKNTINCIVIASKSTTKMMGNDMPSASLIKGEIDNKRNSPMVHWIWKFKIFLPTVSTSLACLFFLQTRMGTRILPNGKMKKASVAKLIHLIACWSVAKVPSLAIRLFCKAVGVVLRACAKTVRECPFGRLSPASNRWIVLRDKPLFSASIFCVYPYCSLCVLMAFMS